MTFVEFLASKYNTIWINEEHFTAYVRKATHLLTKEVCCDCYDIASISVDEDMRGKGVFTEFLGRVEALAERDGRAVFVESIHERRLIDFLRSRGYEWSVFYQEPSPSYFKLPTKFENKLAKVFAI